jgi:hypothetical protein
MVVGAVDVDDLDVVVGGEFRDPTGVAPECVRPGFVERDQLRGLDTALFRPGPEGIGPFLAGRLARKKNIVSEIPEAEAKIEYRLRGPGPLPVAV